MSKISVLSAAILVVLTTSCAEDPLQDHDSGLVPEPAPLDMPYDTQALVVVLNPNTDSITNRQVSTPGALVQDVFIQNQTGQSTYTDRSGIGILSGLSAGYHALSFEIGNEYGTLQGVSVQDHGITELMVSLAGDQASIMSEIAWGQGTPLELIPQVTGGIPLTVIDQSDVFVRLPPGTFEGSLEINGDNVRIYGDEFLDEWPAVGGKVTVNGRNVQMRGVWVRGELQVTGSQFSMAYGGADGKVHLDGNNATMLNIIYCQGVVANASGILSTHGSSMPFTPDCQSPVQ